MTKAGLLLAVFAMMVACGARPSSFDKQRWGAERGNYGDDSARTGMVHLLDDAGVRVGAKREQVRALLGQPDSTGSEADIYYLGRSRSGPSYETYRIDYSPAGVVTQARVERI